MAIIPSTSGDAALARAYQLMREADALTVRYAHLLTNNNNIKSKKGRKSLGKKKTEKSGKENVDPAVTYGLRLVREAAELEARYAYLL